MYIPDNQHEALTLLADQAQDWESYARLHPTVPYTDEWAREIVLAFVGIVVNEYGSVLS